MPGRPVHTFEVVRTEQLTSHMIRVVLGGSGFDTFTPSEFTDSYVKLVFVADDVDVAGLAQPLTLDSFAELPAAKQPVVRTITVRHADPAAREIAVDIAVHGEHGTAGPWAASTIVSYLGRAPFCSSADAGLFLQSGRRKAKSKRVKRQSRYKI